MDTSQVTEDAWVSGGSVIKGGSAVGGSSIIDDLSLLDGATVGGKSKIVGSDLIKTQVQDAEVTDSVIDRSHILDTSTIESCEIMGSFIKSCLHIRHSTVKISHLVNWATIKNSRLYNCRSLGRYLDLADIRDNREILTISGFLSLWDLSAYPRKDGRIGISFGAGCFALEDFLRSVKEDFPDYPEEIEEIQETTDLLVKILVNRMKATRESRKYSKGIHIIPEESIRFRN